MTSQSLRLAVWAFAVALATLAIMAATEPLLAIVWDEGYTLGREERLRQWFGALRDPAAFAARWKPQALELVQQEGASPPAPDQIDTRAKLLFDPQVLAYFWPFARAEPHGHPPFYALLGLTGDVLAPSWQELSRARLGPILLFSLAAGWLFHLVARAYGPWAGTAAAGAWVFQPNLFGHGHYAAYDAVLTSLWVIALACFWRAVAVPPQAGGDAAGKLPVSWPWVLGFGVAAGCSLATKLTGWFLPLPFLVWALWMRDRRALRVLGWGIPLALAVAFLLIPPWWSEPIGGPIRFFRSNLTRAQTIPISVQFLGNVYDTPRESLPWYNTLVWTLMVTPVGFLALGVAGTVRSLTHRREEPLSLLILANWAFLMTLRALPHTPGHDGVRLFLPAFGMLAVLAGLGGRQLLDRSVRWGRILIAGALAEGAVSLLVMMPVPLSYFSPLVGGLPGAARLGMEPTYYWDALSTEARSWLRTQTAADRTIRFGTFPTSWFYLRRTGELPARLFPLDRGQPAWYVLQNRPGAWSGADRMCVTRVAPAFTVRKLGVPLLWIFPETSIARGAPMRR